MKVGIVVGNLVSTIKIPSHAGQKLMLVQELDVRKNAGRRTLIAIDHACAGIGESVLYSEEGGVCKLTLGEDMIADAVILGVLDSCNVCNDYRKGD